MSDLRTQVASYFDRNWFPYAIGFNGVATVVSFLMEHGVLLISLVCTAIAPVIFRLIMVIREKKLSDEKLRHEKAMNLMQEEKLRLEIDKLKREQSNQQAEKS